MCGFAIDVAGVVEQAVLRGDLPLARAWQTRRWVNGSSGRS